MTHNNRQREIPESGGTRIPCKNCGAPSHFGWCINHITKSPEAIEIYRKARIYLDRDDIEQVERDHLKKVVVDAKKL